MVRDPSARWTSAVTGVLVKRDGGWKITQYNLTIPIPNEIALEVVERIREVIQARSD